MPELGEAVEVRIVSVTEVYSMKIRKYRTFSDQEILRLYACVGRTAHTDYPEAMKGNI